MTAMPKVTSIFVLFTSETSFANIEGIPSAIWAIRGIRKVWPNEKLYFCAHESDASKVQSLLKEFGIEGELIFCDVLSPQKLAISILDNCQTSDLLVFQDASRPLINSANCTTMLSRLREDVDAIRPAIAFTETLKFIDENRVIEETLDRTSVKRVSTPQIIRMSAIDPDGENTGWLVPLRADVNKLHIEGDPTDLRMNDSTESDLFESYFRFSQNAKR